VGFNDTGAVRVVFDIETAPLAVAADYLEPVEAPANYKDPIKIAAAIAEKTAEQLSRCSLDVDLCRVVAIGYQFADTDAPTVLTAPDEAQEVAALTQFWTAVGDRHLVGFNCLAFDLPVLLRRSLYLDVPAPRLQVDRFKHPSVTDVMQLLSFNGTLRLRGLSFYTKRFGFVVPPDTLTGADIPEAVATGRWTDVEQHVRADVLKTALLAERLGVFSLRPEMAL
jgi:predicted PolB exonuclease-like 3'-5' exonuclease